VLNKGENLLYANQMEKIRYLRLMKSLSIICKFLLTSFFSPPLFYSPFSVDRTTICHQYQNVRTIASA
jgi:hypothetical protein